MRTKWGFFLTLVLGSNAALAEPENHDLSGLHSLNSSAHTDHEDHKTEHEHVFTPEQEEAFKLRIQRPGAMGSGFRFAQSKWNECSFDPSGNYSGYACARARQISVILQEFLSEQIYECVDAGLRAQGGGAASDIHIIHDGILGDRNHSPRSLHAEARAIDIKALEVKLANGQKRKLTYAGSTNRAFYRAFRSCWGQMLRRENGCPLYAGNAERTGTIGWEDRNHQQHMHTSVPYCVSGRYGSYYYQR